MANVSKVLLVGHCGFDASMLQSAVESVAGDATVMMVNRRDQLDEHGDCDALLLINRVLDGPLDADDGIDLITQLAGGDNAPKMMLVSNYPDAQQAAVRAGALPGFGKNDLRDATTSDRLRNAIAS